MPRLTCPYCGKDFHIPNAWIKKGQSHCCSRECAAALRRTHAPVDRTGQERRVCACGCGATFLVPGRAPNRQYKRGHGRTGENANFVSATCANCGARIRVHPSRLSFAHQYCSRGCAGQYRSSRTTASFTCKQCGKEFATKRSRRPYGRAFCSNACVCAFRAAQPDSRVRVTCADCGLPMEVFPHKLKTNKQFYCSRECRAHHMTGPNNPSYVHGHGRKLYYGLHWRRQRAAALARDGFRCRQCGRTPKVKRLLHVHHITPAHLFTDRNKANELSNLITLCVRCHKAAEIGRVSVQRRML